MPNINTLRVLAIAATAAIGITAALVIKEVPIPPFVMLLGIIWIFFIFGLIVEKILNGNAPVGLAPGDAPEIGVGFPAPVRVECRSEIVAIGEPARIRVYEHDRLIAEIVGTVDRQQGADGGYYPAVALTERLKVKD